MKGIMIAAPNSGSGKTIITAALLRAFLIKGYNVCAFKTGPDFIDTAFLKAASKKPAGNLDMHLQGRTGIKKAIGMGEGEYCIIEGVMGYFDGIYNTFENSSYDISRELNINSILVYSPEAEMFSAVPKLKGMAEFKDSNIKGVILNKVSKEYYEMLKPKIEEYTDLKVLGYVPNIRDMDIESRHLGLIQSSEINDIDKRIEIAAEIISEFVNINLIINLMKDIESIPIEYPKRKNIRAAVAMDKAFSFYYRENLKLLQECCTVEYFSPLKDKHLPKCDFIYIGGGYPEVFKKELSKNKEILADIKDFAERGGLIYAECGGFMYLTESIEGSKMAGILNGSSTMTKQLQNFGYADIELKENCLLGRTGNKITAQEFHKSVTNVSGDTIYYIKGTGSKRNWSCGYSYKNVLAGYAHINFIGNMDSFKYMLNYIEENISKDL
ncbi:MAG: cobyrinate a,c-diamide synthase [Solirubrobacterales bacterium]